MMFHNEKDVEKHLILLISKEENTFLFPKLETDVMALPDLVFCSEGILCVVEVKFIPKNRQTIPISSLFARQLVVLDDLLKSGALGGVITNKDICDKSINEHLVRAKANFKKYYEKCYKRPAKS